MLEYIFEIGDALYDEENQEAVFKPEYKGKLVRCKDCIWKYGTDCTRFAEVRVSPEDYCSRGEAKTKRGKHEKEQS